MTPVETPGVSAWRRGPGPLLHGSQGPAAEWPPGPRVTRCVPQCVRDLHCAHQGRPAGHQQRPCRRVCGTGGGEGYKLPPQGPRSQRGAPGSAPERELFSSWQKPCFSTKPDPRAASPRKLSLPLPVLATSVVRSAVCCLQSLRAVCAGSCTGSVNPGWWVTEARGQREGALSLLPLAAPQGLRLPQPCSPAQETPDPWPLPPFAC